MAKPKEAPDADDLETTPEGEDTGPRRRRTIPIESKAIPAGVRAVLKMKPWRDAPEFSAYIYQVTRDNKGKESRRFLDRIFNEEIEESFLQAKYPRGGKFRVMYQIKAQEKGGDAEIYTDDYEIEAVAAANLVAPGSSAPPVPAQAGAGDQGGRRAALGDLRELAEIIVLLRPAADPGAAAGAAAPAWLERMYRDRLREMEDTTDKLRRRLNGGLTVHSENGKEATEAGDAWPEFLRPFVPQIKQFGIDTLGMLAEKLLGGGLQAAGLRALVTAHPGFRQLWGDVERRNAAAAAIVQHLGEAGENLIQLFESEMNAKAGAP